MFSLKNQHKSRRGFTLIELLIVIAIIGVLAAILAPVMMRARFKSYHAACVANERNLATALEMYSLEYEQLYPPDLPTLTSGSSPYISVIEDCPSSQTSYVATYTVSADFKTYVLECPGRHDIQLTGMVEPNYPRTENGKVNQFRPD